MEAFQWIYDIRLTDKELLTNGFPRVGQLPGTAKIFRQHPETSSANTKNIRNCDRCEKNFNLDQYNQKCIDQCQYHLYRAEFQPARKEKMHRCCKKMIGSPGCRYFNYHVFRESNIGDNLPGYVKTSASRSVDYVPTANEDIFALDCEMCYTTGGLEVTRVTAINWMGIQVYDSLVKPANKIMDYNTIFSGINAQMMDNMKTKTLREVQTDLMRMMHNKTILIGHSLESDLKALKLIHDVVVDTSVLYPHKQGPPFKRSLKTLAKEKLMRNIQENSQGHSSAEDAVACIDLLKVFLRSRNKMV